jgi:peptidoglycan/xylan/chitin deacetylase (PgdA/CDA1 family)
MPFSRLERCSGAAALCIALAVASPVLAEDAVPAPSARAAVLCGPPPPEKDGLPEVPPPPQIVKLKAPVLPPVAPIVVSRVSGAGRRVALTFDACSVREASQFDAAIAQELLDEKAPATIFLGGRWAEEEAVHVKELAANPLLELGNHTWSHPDMVRVRPERMRQELLRDQDEVFSITGVEPHLFRPPFGEYDHQVVEEAAKLGLTTVEFDLASGDPDPHATKDRLIEWVLRKAGPGSIVVMHINGRGWHTAEALPSIIDGLRDRGYELVTVSDLLKYGTPDPSADQVVVVAGETVSHVRHSFPEKRGPCLHRGLRTSFDAPRSCATNSAWLPARL